LVPSFFDANLELTDDIPKFNLFDKHHIFTRARMLPPSKISGTQLDKAIVADGCIISASLLKRSVIGIRTRIGEGTTLENCYVMGSDNYQTLEQIRESKESDAPIMGIGNNCCIKMPLLTRTVILAIM
jgi:glucose-1-phosphate adenylyltransferase